jgi:hypothetical protein
VGNILFNILGMERICIVFMYVTYKMDRWMILLSEGRRTKEAIDKERKEVAGKRG